MIKPARLIAIATFVVLAISCTNVFAHPGRTDENGGHNGPDGYHYHHGYPEHQHPDGTCQYDFDDQTNRDGGGVTESVDDTDTIETSKKVNDSPSLPDYVAIIIIVLPLVLVYPIYRLFCKIVETLQEKSRNRKADKVAANKDMIIETPRKSFKKTLHNFFSSYAFIGAVILIGVSVLGMLQAECNDLTIELSSAQDELINLQGQRDELKELNDELLGRNSYLEDELVILNEDNSEMDDAYYGLMDAAQEWKYKADFFDENAALVTESGNKYHTYDCRYFQDSTTGYWIYSDVAALDKGYTACSVCH